MSLEIKTLTADPNTDIYAQSPAVGGYYIKAATRAIAFSTDDNPRHHFGLATAMPAADFEHALTSMQIALHEESPGSERKPDVLLHGLRMHIDDAEIVATSAAPDATYNLREWWETIASKYTPETWLATAP